MEVLHFAVYILGVIGLLTFNMRQAYRSQLDQCEKQLRQNEGKIQQLNRELASEKALVQAYLKLVNEHNRKVEKIKSIPTLAKILLAMRGLK